eukprot:Rhum_TRINITY_DN12962_c0_g1::Rhum_TRINITY_DN12962_c0_g1_i1::g.55556::m.55556
MSSPDAAAAAAATPPARAPPPVALPAELLYADGTWLRRDAVEEYVDDVGAAVEVLRTAWCDGAAYGPVLTRVCRYAGRWFEQRVGVPPTAKKADLRAAADAHAALKAELAAATRELSRLYCMPEFSADASYDSTPARVGYLLKYTAYNACITAAIVARHSPALLGARTTTAPASPIGVACYGGGPGTDYLGVAAACGFLGVPIEHARVYDLPCWADFWPATASSASTSSSSSSSLSTPPPPPPQGYLVESTDAAAAAAAATGDGDGDGATQAATSVAFEALDLLSEEAAADPLKGFAPASPPALVTFFYTVNEMANEAGDRAAFLRFFTALVDSLGAGASILVVDRTRAAVVAFLAELAEALAGRVEVVCLSRRVEPVMPTQLTNRVCDFAAKFGVKPRLCGKAGVTIFKVREK